MSLAEIAQEKGIKKIDLVTKIQFIMKVNLDQAVQEQKITAEKATQIESKLPQMVERMVNRTNVAK